MFQFGFFNDEGPQEILHSPILDQESLFELDNHDENCYVPFSEALCHLQHSLSTIAVDQQLLEEDQALIYSAQLFHILRGNTPWSSIAFKSEDNHRCFELLKCDYHFQVYCHLILRYSDLNAKFSP
jgi:hypothetical protein